MENQEFLKEYHKKRNFDVSSEPFGKSKNKKDKEIFVIQKHLEAENPEEITTAIQINKRGNKLYIYREKWIRTNQCCALCNEANRSHSCGNSLRLGGTGKLFLNPTDLQHQKYFFKAWKKTRSLERY